MLKLSKKADYGLIAVRHLAEQPPAGACSAKEIARTYGIPTELLAKYPPEVGQEWLADFPAWHQRRICLGAARFGNLRL